MQDVLNALAGGANTVGIAKIDLLEPNRGPDVFKVFQVARRQIVDSGHIVSIVHKPVGKGRPYEPGDAGDEITCHFYL
jgi:hypothetical protein